MYAIPDFSRSFEYENDFWLSCGVNRLSKVLAHYELYRRAQNLSGELVECGVFKGASLVRFAMMREMLGNPSQKKIIAFDAFGRFPETDFEPDKQHVERWTADAGQEGISETDLRKVLENKGCENNVEFIAGDIRETVPQYVSDHPELRISLLNLDTDVYEPAVTILEQFWPRIVPGGVLILDDYGVFPGETIAVDEFFESRQAVIQKFPFSKTPSFVIKGDGGNGTNDSSSGNRLTQ